jgi:hypothetical protein
MQDLAEGALGGSNARLALSDAADANRIALAELARVLQPEA